MPFADSRGAAIYWREAGAGPPLLLVMGIGYTSDMWHSVEARLAAGNRLLLFDNRGVGRSDPIPPGYTIGDMARDALAVLDAAGVPSANLFGMSMGGYVAQEFALQYPERLRALILGCTSFGGERAIPADDEVWHAAQARRSMSAEDAVRALVPYIYAAGTPAADIDADLEIRLRHYPSQDAYDRQLAAIGNWQSADRLERIAAPTLVLHGAGDRLIPPENGRRLAAAIRGARYREIGDASHIFTTDQPALTARYVQDFLASLR